MTDGAAHPRFRRLTHFVANLLASGTPLVNVEEVQRTRYLASGNTFIVWSGVHRNKAVALKYFNFKAPQDCFSSLSLDNESENLRKNLSNASYEIRIMTNNVLRRCPNIATLEGVFFQAEDSAWIRPALVMELAYDAAPTLTELLRLPCLPLTPLIKCSLINNIFDGLYALHSIGICHGDIKPDNVLIFSVQIDSRVPFQARISDFGFAFVSGQVPRGNGTEGWRAPECDSESLEPQLREMAFGRDVFSAALIMDAVFDAPVVARLSYEKDQRIFDHSLRLIERMRNELRPRMIRELRTDRPWILDLRKDLTKMFEEEGVEPLQWSWNIKKASVTRFEIEPVEAFAELQGRISTWLVNHKEIRNLSAPIQYALFQEIEACSKDPDNLARADHLNAIGDCYYHGRLTNKNNQKAWDAFSKAARSGSRFAQDRVIYEIMATGQLYSSSAEERRDWSIKCLSSMNSLSHKLLSAINAVVCEKGLQATIYDSRTAMARRTAKHDQVPSLEDMIEGVMKPQYPSIIPILLPKLTTAVYQKNYESLEEILNSNIDTDQLRKVLLQACLEYAVLHSQKELMYFLFSRFTVDAVAVNPVTQQSALTLALFEDRNHAVTWLLDLGVDRELFCSQLHFALIVCNSALAMTVTYIQTCKTYWRETGLLRLLNDCAPPVQGRKIPPPIMLSILTKNELSFGALLRYDVDVNKQWGLWTPLLLSVAKGLPHFVSQLIEKGAHINECIKDETAMRIAHVLSDSRLSNSANENQLLWDLFDWAPLDRSRAPFTRLQAQRYTDTLLYHLLKAAGASFNVRDAAGNLPLETAILTGKLWIADLLFENRSSSVTTPKDFRDLKDVHGQNILFYALEDEYHITAENLLRHGYDINASGVNGSTPLHEAVERSSLNTVSFCIRHGANGLQKDYCGRTAFILSASLGNTEICKTIVNHVGGQVFLEWTAENATFIHCTAKPSLHKTLQVLIDLYFEMRASESENLPNLYEVVKHTDIWGSTCLQTACCPRDRRSKFAPNISTIAPVEKLLSLFASPSQAVSTTDYMLDTPLHSACDNSNTLDHSLRCARLLVDAGANINAQNELGNTPLHLAYLKSGDNEALTKFLIGKGADSASRNQYGLTPEEWGSAVAENVAKEAARKYSELFYQRSRWKNVQESFQSKKSKEEKSCAERRRLWLQRQYENGTLDKSEGSLG